MSTLDYRGYHEATRIHYIFRRRVSMAAGCARSTSEVADNRISGGGRTVGMDPLDCCLCPAAKRTWLDRGAHSHDRISLGGGKNRALSRIRRGVCASQGGCDCYSRE